MLGRHAHPNLTPADAAALFWWARNMLLFQLDLAGRESVYLCSYERLVNDPHECLGEIYRFLNLPLPRGDLTRGVRAQPGRRGARTELSPPVDDLCERLYGRMQQYFGMPAGAGADDDPSRP